MYQVTYTYGRFNNQLTLPTIEEANVLCDFLVNMTFTYISIEKL